MLKHRAVTSLSCASYTYSTQHGRHDPLYIPHQHTARFTPTVRLCIHYSISHINAHHKHYFLLDSLQPSPLTLCHQPPLTLTGTLHPSPSLAPFIPHLTGTLHPSPSLAPFTPHLTGTLHPLPCKCKSGKKGVRMSRSSWLKQRFHINPHGNNFI